MLWQAYNDSECGAQYSSYRQVAFCDVEKPPLWPPVLQVITCVMRGRGCNYAPHSIHLSLPHTSHSTHALQPKHKCCRAKGQGCMHTSQTPHVGKSAAGEGAGVYMQPNFSHVLRT